MTDLEAIFNSLVMDFRKILLEGDSAAIFVGVGDDATSPMVPPTGMHPTDALRTMAWAVNEGRIPRPEWAVLCSDSYGQHEPPPGQKVTRGTLEARFIGGDPSVYECILVTMMHQDGTHLMGQQKYTRRHLPALNREVIDFGEFERWDADPNGVLDGAVPDALKDLLGI